MLGKKVILNANIITLTIDSLLLAGKTLLKGRIGAVTVGHIPRELFRYNWYGTREGIKLEAIVYDIKC